MDRVLIKMTGVGVDGRDKNGANVKMEVAGECFDGYDGCRCRCRISFSGVNCGI